jgi:nucleoside-diphosphate-sugar epimerase
MKLFVAGATGAIGLPLVRALCTLFYEVAGRGASVDGAVGECLMGRPGGSPHAAEFDPAMPQWLR